MPTSLGHGLAGLTILWCARAAQHRGWMRQSVSRAAPPAPDAVVSGWRSPQVMFACACLAVAPDLDLILGGHRTITHSLTGALLAGGLAAWMMRRVRNPAPYSTLVFSLAWASHLVLDWLGSDSSPPYGIMALWPFSDRWFISNLDVFTDVSRRYWLPRSFWLGNLASVARELVILGPVAAAAWRLARPVSTGRIRDRSSCPGVLPPPSS